MEETLDRDNLTFGQSGPGADAIAATPHPGRECELATSRWTPFTHQRLTIDAGAADVTPAFLDLAALANRVLILPEANLTRRNFSGLLRASIDRQENERRG